MFAFILFLILDEQLKETQVFPCVLRLEVAVLCGGAGLSPGSLREGWPRGPPGHSDAHSDVTWENGHSW